MLKCIRPAPKLVYGIHDPEGFAILTQLRVGLRELNFNKFRHNFKDEVNPLCPANDGVEDIEHFLLHCRSYQAPMSDLLNSVSAILLPYGFSSLSSEVLLRYMLYGDQSLTFETSKRLLEATLTFIHATERFKTISVLTIPYIGTYPYFLFSKSQGVVASRIELDDTICSWGSTFHVGYNQTNNLKHS